MKRFVSMPALVVGTAGCALMLAVLFTSLSGERPWNSTFFWSGALIASVGISVACWAGASARPANFGGNDRVPGQQRRLNWLLLPAIGLLGGGGLICWIADKQLHATRQDVGSFGTVTMFFGVMVLVVWINATRRR